jgi:hypothetical protein
MAHRNTIYDSRDLQRGVQAQGIIYNYGNGIITGKSKYTQKTNNEKGEM